MTTVDFDDFTTINDTQGHAAGDEVLAQVATRLASTIRAGATVARLGGDEFAVLVEDLPEVDDAVSLAERVRETFAAPFAAKESGKGQCVLYREDLRTRILDRLTRRADRRHRSVGAG